jgi:phytol kinase
MAHEALWIVIISGLFLLVFLIADCWQRFGNPKPETTRKFVHMAGGLIALGFPLVFHSHWSVLILCVGFVTIIATTKKLGLLPCVHGVERQSEGGIYHPIAIYVCFLLASVLQQPVFYVLSILVLSVSDALAALIGKTYGFKLYCVEEDHKSFEGSIIFFLATFLIVQLGLLLYTPTGRLESVLIALLIAILVTAFEAISLGGADNLFIPLSVFFLLAKNIAKTPEELGWQFLIQAGILGLAYAIASPAKKLGGTGILVLALFAYAIVTLANPYWCLPLLVGTILIANTTLFLEKAKNPNELKSIRPVFYAVVVPLCWVLLNNLTFTVFSLYWAYLFAPPFLTALACHLNILWEKKRRFSHFETTGEVLVSQGFNTPRVWMMRSFIFVFGLGASMLYPKLNPAFTVITSLAGVGLTDWLYWKIATPKMGIWQQRTFLRLGMAVIGTVTALVFVVQWFYYQPLAVANLLHPFG